ncbi:50S ribosomal protein L31 [Buchnera aphidicola]|uniref:50S ribosomal protein L31 n=1 Tax=Buchnera aphidicola TaxID=9 RepID=UPI0034638655
MNKNIHPKYNKVSANCVCGNNMIIFTTLSKSILNLDVCSHCHPFYTGKQRIVNHGGRIEQFNKKFS